MFEYSNVLGQPDGLSFFSSDSSSGAPMRPHGSVDDGGRRVKFGKFEVGAVAYGVTDLPLGGGEFARASAQG